MPHLCITEEVWGREYTAPAAGVWLQIKVTSWGHYLSSTAAQVCRYYTCCLHIIALGWEPQTHIWIHTHNRVHINIHTETKQADETQFTDRPTQIQQIYTHILTAKSQMRTRHTDTLCAIPRLTELKQMKELVNEIWLNSLKCSTAARRASAEQNDNISQSCHSKNQQENPNKGLS